MRGNLHWLAFVSLLQNLPAESAFGRLVAIRTCDVPQVTKHNQKQVQALMKAKAANRLRLTKEEEKSQFQAGIAKLAEQMINSAKGGEQNG